MNPYDVIIVGGGPAGLNAAVVLGRCLRSVLLFDSEQYRNRWSHGMHNYLTQDDILPSEFIKKGQAEAIKYGVTLLTRKVVRARKGDEGYFKVQDDSGAVHYSRKLLIATGLADQVPQLPGFEEFYGASVHHCPYCDGWEVRGQRLGVYAKEKNGHELAMALKGWSPHVTLYTDGKGKLKPEHRENLAALGINIIDKPLKGLEGQGQQLHNVVFRDGTMDPCDTLFFVNGYRQSCNLVETFDCALSRKGVVVTNRFQQTTTPGLYVAGDADKDMHFVVVAASEGAKAGVIINKELQKEINDAIIKKRPRTLTQEVFKPA